MMRFRFGSLIRLARPHFLLGTGVIFMVGALFARDETGTLSLPALLGGLITLWLVQLSTHFTNEYYDLPTDRLNRQRTPFSGGSGMLASGTLDPRVAWWAGGLCLLLALVGFGYLSGLATFTLGTAAIFGLAMLFAVGYTVPPLCFVYRGYGEATTTITVGLLVPLFAHNLQTGRISGTLLLVCLPFCALILANLLTVAFPDYGADLQTGKRTLVVSLGPARSARLYTFLVILGYTTPWLTLGWGLPLAVLLAETATIPVALLSLREIRRGGYYQPERFRLNTFLGVSTVMAVAIAELAGMLLAA